MGLEAWLQISIFNHRTFLQTRVSKMKHSVQCTDSKSAQIDWEDHPRFLWWAVEHQIYKIANSWGVLGKIKNDIKYWYKIRYKKSKSQNIFWFCKTKITNIRINKTRKIDKEGTLQLETWRSLKCDQDSFQNGKIKIEKQSKAKQNQSKWNVNNL